MHDDCGVREPGDLVVDIFAGSNTTGSVAECEGRKWLAFDERLDYLAASSFRFFAEAATDAELKAAHAAILHGKTADLRADVLRAPKQSVRNGRVHQLATPAQGLLILAETATPAAPVRTAKLKAVADRHQPGGINGGKSLAP